LKTASTIVVTALIQDWIAMGTESTAVLIVSQIVPQKPAAIACPGSWTAAVIRLIDAWIGAATLSMAAWIAKASALIVTWIGAVNAFKDGVARLPTSIKAGLGNGFAQPFTNLLRLLI